MKTITRSELAARMNADHPPILIEALPGHYFADGHIPGAINIPHDEIDQQAPQRLPDKQAEIVVYCVNTACKNSGIAARTLEQMGYSNIFEYVEGKQDWQAAGLPLVSETETTATAA